VRQANKHVRVVAEKSPVTVAVVVTYFVHNFSKDINITTLVTGQ
jgi:hypothetical protein